MKLYQLILAVFGFSAWMVMLNAMGIFTINLPVQTDVSISSSQITELTSQNGAEEGTGILDMLSGAVGMLGAAVSIFVTATGAVLSFPGLLEDYGIPVAFTGMLLTMITLISVFGLAKLLTNRSDKGME